jgi:hypothetical protein
MTKALAQVQSEPPRIAELRASMAAGIPCEAKYESVARRELGTLPFPGLLTLYLNWAHRFVPMGRRKVEYVSGFWDAPVAQSHGGNILNIAGRIERGDDLTTLLSRLVHNRGYVPRHIRAGLPPEKKRWRDKDFALNALGVHHLHISNPPVGSRSAERGNEIVFVEFTTEIARFVLAGTHADFHGERLSYAVAKMRAEAGFTIKGAQLRDPPRPHAELSALAAAGLSTFTSVGDQVVPLYLLSADGTPVFLVKQVMQIHRTLASIEPKIDEPGWASDLFGRVGIPMPPSVQFDWVLQNTALHLRERVSGTYFGAVPSYR